LTIEELFNARTAEFERHKLCATRFFPQSLQEFIGRTADLKSRSALLAEWSFDNVIEYGTYLFPLEIRRVPRRD
jgi:hypothetical protein